MVLLYTLGGLCQEPSIQEPSMCIHLSVSLTIAPRIGAEIVCVQVVHVGLDHSYQ